MVLIRDADIFKPFPTIGKGFFIVLILLLKTTVSFCNSNSFWVYVDNTKNIGESGRYISEITTVVYSSRWLNAHFIRTDFLEQIKKIEQLNFVKDVVPASKLFLPEPLEEPELARENFEYDPLNFWHQNFSDAMYGQFKQTSLIHLLNFFDLTVENAPDLNVGVIDAGFLTNHSIFSRINIVGNRNFTTENVTSGISGHGNRVLSLIGGYYANVMKTAGINCNFVLAKTEVDEFERRIEEYHLVHALEWLVDTMNVSMINISLGYSQFDDPSENYTVEDLDGNTTASARAVNIAAERGALVFVAAGNSGMSAWRHITTPADAHGAITVGSLTQLGEKALTSSVGIEGNDIKPDIMAQGQGVISHAGDVRGFTPASGTSFASPLALSSAIMLKRIHPLLSNREIEARLISTAANYESPNHFIGHGTINTLAAITDSTTLSGFVLDSDSLPINDALVRFSFDNTEHIIRTASDGFWFMKIEPSVPDGGTLEIEKHGYVASVIEAASDSVITIVLENSPNSILHYARLVNERIISQVTAEYATSSAISFFTNYDGSFRIDTSGLTRLAFEGFFEESQLQSIATLPLGANDTTHYMGNGYYRITFIDDNLHPIGNLGIVVSTGTDNRRYFTSSLGEIIVSYRDIGSRSFFVEYQGTDYLNFRREYSFVLGDVQEDVIVLAITEKLYPVPLLRPDYRLFLRGNNQNRISIYNSSGRRVEANYEYDISGSFFVINTANKAPGIYYIVTDRKRHKFLIIE